jgi:hypothetical protein
LLSVKVDPCEFHELPDEADRHQLGPIVAETASEGGGSVRLAGLDAIVEVKPSRDETQAAGDASELSYVLLS